MNRVVLVGGADVVGFVTQKYREILFVNVALFVTLLLLYMQGDVILSFDSIPIANDGTVPFRSGERISFGYLVSQKYTGETATLRVSRQGEEMDVDVRLRIPKRLVSF